MDENLFEVDPNLLTIPKLKAILSENGVQLPMRNEKKAFYVDLFRKHITAKADTIRKRQQAIKPSSAGIMAVSSRGSPLVNEKVVTIYCT